VLLVAWKEHLLECTRSTSTAAALERLDGAGLTAALRDALAQRAALEQRLAQHDAVHGRLDGLTPRLLLQMVCNRSPNALLSLRSGDLGFEFSIADGRPVHARWYEADAQRAEAHAVLGPFLGVRTGRFSVEPLFSPPVSHFEGDVMAVLNPAVRRVRQAVELVQPRSLRSVEHVRIEPLLAERYLLEAPASRALITRLGNGTPLGPLLAEDAAGNEPGRLSAVLGELARRGALLALLGHDGRDLISGTASAPNEPSVSRASPPTPRGWSPTVSFAPPPAPAMDLRDAVLQAVSAPAEDTPVSRPEPVSAEESRSNGREPNPALTGATIGATRALDRSAAEESGPPLREESGPSAAPQATPRAGISETAEDADRGRTTELHADEPTASAADGPDASAAHAAAETSAEETSAEETSAATSPTPPKAEESALEREPNSNPDARATASSKSLDSQWPPPRGARLRAAFAPLFVSVAAGLLAFLAIRIFAVGASRSPRLPAPAAERGPAPAVARPRPLAADASAPRQPETVPPAATAQPIADFTSELLDLPPRTKLLPGQGLLEVHAGQRQQIYVDGVFMGNYDNRVIALQPGSYHLRLSAGGRDVEQTVEIRAGRRTRVSARANTSP
jgi:hypothetical protein